MVYVPTIWKNREVERPRTFTMQNNGDGTITLIPAEGKVNEQGTPIVADNLNKIEQGIANSISAIEKGIKNGIATLDLNAQVPLNQLGNVPLPQDASTTRKGIVQLNNTVTSTSITQAATANAVKQVYDMVVDSGNLTPSLNTGWTTEPSNPLIYRKIGRVVFIQGVVKANTSNPSSFVFTLPLGYRPKENNTIIGDAFANGSALGYGKFTNLNDAVWLNGLDVSKLTSGIKVTLSACFVIDY